MCINTRCDCHPLKRASARLIKTGQLICASKETHRTYVNRAIGIGNK